MPFPLLALPDELVQCILDTSLRSKRVADCLRMTCKALRREVHAIMLARLAEYRTRCDIWLDMPSRYDVLTTTREGETLSSLILRCRFPVHARYYIALGDSRIRMFKTAILSNLMSRMKAGYQITLSVVQQRKRPRFILY